MPSVRCGRRPEAPGHPALRSGAKVTRLHVETQWQRRAGVERPVIDGQRLAVPRRPRWCFAAGRSTPRHPAGVGQ